MLRSRGLVIAAIGAPWLCYLPTCQAIAVLLCAIRLIAAFHGFGLVVARLARTPSREPMLLVQWGIATTICLGSIAIGLHIFDRGVQTFVVFVGCAVHTVVVGLDWRAYAARVARRFAGARIWLVPLAVLLAIGAIHVLGAAGDVETRGFDDDGNQLTQLARLANTGMLGDPIGFARHAQLGGALVLPALAPGADAGIALVLTAGLVCARIRARDAASGIWMVLAIVLCASTTAVLTDVSPSWTAVGLVVAMWATLDDDRPLPAVLLAAAAIALRLELAPFALACIALRGRNRHALVLLVLVPIAVDRLRLAVPAALVPSNGSLVAHLASCAGIALVLVPLLLLVLPDRTRPAPRAIAIGCALAIAAIASQLVGTPGYSSRFAAVLIVGFALCLIADVAQRRATASFAAIVSLVICLLVYEAGSAPGRARWSRRSAEMFAAIEYFTHPTPPPVDPYQPLLEKIPHGATVALWVLRPELIDDAWDTVDLRVPRIAALRGGVPKKLVTARYLLLEGAPPHGLGVERPAIATSGQLRLIDLGP